MFCTNPNCPGGSVTYCSPTEYDEVVVMECTGCGATWDEPNPRYIEAERDRLEDDYYRRWG